MKKRTGILGILIAILALGIGYAAISAITLTITGTGKITPNTRQENFKVEFTDIVEQSGTNIEAQIDDSDTTKATIKAEGFTQKYDSTHQEEQAYFVFEITNNSPENITADLQEPQVTITNEDFFSVETEYLDPTMVGQSETTYLKVTIKPIKTPLVDDQTTDITITLDANPVEA